ncbi:MAG: HAMP domain-containing sensor histidine kinase [Propionicimonas sp.]
MKAWSLRRRLVAGSVALLGVALLLAAIASVILFKTFQIRQVDEQLGSLFGQTAPAQAQTVIRQLCEASQDGGDPQLPTSFAAGVFDSAGELSCQLPATGPAPDWASLDAASLAAAAADQSIIGIRSTDGEPGGWRGRTLVVADGYVVIAESLADIEAAARRLALICLTVDAVILLIATAAGVALVRLGLRPLTEIEKTAGEIAGGDFSRRIEVTTTNTEVGRLATSLNVMLTQIQAAFTERDRTEERLRRFVADASHELRTPLSTIRGHAELVRTGVVSDPVEIARVVSRIEAESIRMASLVDDLLLLARLDTTRSLEQRPIDLLIHAVDVAADTRVTAPGRSITVAKPVEPPWQDQPAIALGDDARLRQILTNLAGNALKHTPPDTPIEFEVGVRDGHVRVAVVDHGPGLQIGNETRVFERFFREDPGRGRAKGGAGLGLAIASSLAGKFGGTLAYRPTPGGGSSFELTLPLAEV